MRDGPPEPGLSWTSVKLNSGLVLARWVFKCMRCEREHSWSKSGTDGGINAAEAQKIGWRLLRGMWVCFDCDPPADWPISDYVD